MRVLAPMKLGDVGVGKLVRGQAGEVGVTPHPFLAAGDPVELTVEIDVPDPAEARLGEGCVERVAMALLRLGQRSVDVEYQRLDHDGPFLLQEPERINRRRSESKS